MKEPKVIRANELKEIDYGGTLAADVLITKTFDIAKIVKTKDDPQAGYNSESDIAYYVLEGVGESNVNGKKYPLKKGDCIFYQKGTAYQHSKGLILLAISSPPFKVENNHYIAP